MAIDGFSFTTIVDGRIDPDSPLDTTLFTDMRDNFEFIQKWLGKSFIGAAVADHDHDGVNSAQVDSSDLTGAAIDNGFVWIDSGTDVGLSTGVKDISAIVAVGTVFVQVYVTYTITSSSTTDIQSGIVGGTMRSIAVQTAENPSTKGFYGAMALLPVDGSRQIEIKIVGGTGFSDNLLEIRSSQK